MKYALYLKDYLIQLTKKVEFIYKPFFLHISQHSFKLLMNQLIIIILVSSATLYLLKLYLGRQQYLE